MKGLFINYDWGYDNIFVTNLISEKRSLFKTFFSLKME